jgi:two-component system NarL family response regulator
MVIRVSTALSHNLLAQGIESYLQGQPDMVLLPARHESTLVFDAVDVPSHEVVLLGLESLHPAAMQRVRSWHQRHHLARLVVLADFHHASELMETLEAGALACVSTTSQLHDVLQAIRCAARGDNYLCQQLSSLMMQGARHQRLLVHERHGLGHREEEVLRLIADGYSSKQIARQLDIAPSTVDVHRRNIMRKIGLHKVADLTRFAIRHQMVTL